MELSKEEVETISFKQSPMIDINTKVEILSKMSGGDIPTPVSNMLKTLLKENQKEPLFRYIMDLKRRAKNNLL